MEEGRGSSALGGEVVEQEQERRLRQEAGGQNQEHLSEVTPGIASAREHAVLADGGVSIAPVDSRGVRQVIDELVDGLAEEPVGDRRRQWIRSDWRASATGVRHRSRWDPPRPRARAAGRRFGAGRRRRGGVRRARASHRAWETGWPEDRPSEGSCRRLAPPAKPNQVKSVIESMT